MSTTWNSEDSFWKRTVAYSAIAVAVVAAGGALYYFKFMKSEAPAAVTPPVSQAPPAAEGGADKEHHPLPGSATPDKPLPKLTDSDPELADALGGLFGKSAIEKLLVPEMVVRHIVGHHRQSAAKQSRGADASGEAARRRDRDGARMATSLHCRRKIPLATRR